MIKFTSVTSKNFRAIGNQPITVYLDRSNTTLVTGSNGSGKTSATVEAIIYCLFNKSYKKSPIGNLVNSSNKKNSLVELNFERGGEKYTIKRGQKPKVFEIWKGDDLIEDTNERGWYQKKLEEIIGMDFNLFTKNVVLNKSQFMPFMSLSTPDRRVIVEKLLDINVFSDMNVELKKKISLNRNDLADSEHHISILEKDIERERALYEMTLKNSQDKFDELTRSKTEKLDTLNKLLDEKAVLTTQLESFAMPFDQHKVSNAIAKLNSYNGGLDSEKRIHNKTLSFFRDNDECPTCSQHIDETYKQDVVYDMETNISSIEEKKERAVSEYTKYESMQKDIDNASREKQIITTQLGTVNSHIRIINGDIETITKQQEKLENTDNNIDDIKNKLLELKNKYTDAKKKYDHLYELKKTYDYIYILFKDNGIKKNIVERYIPNINKLVNRFLNDIGMPMNIVFDAEFNEKVMIPGREKHKYFDFSDGQKTRIDLALLLTWIEVAKSKNSINTNLLVFDEILEALDIEGNEDFIKMIEMNFPNINLFVISQRKNDISHMYRSNIDFKMVNGYTLMQ